MTARRRAALVALMALLGALLGTAPAAAVIPEFAGPRLGPLTVAPATGDGATLLTVTTPQPCSGGNWYLIAYGSGLPDAGGALAFDFTPEGAGTQTEFVATTDLASVQRDPEGAALNGQYDVTLQCINDGASASTGYYGATITVTTTGETISYVVDEATAEPAATTSTLAVAPATTADADADVTLTATVAPAEAAGTVQFTSGAANVGSPAPVAAGVATLTTDALPVGDGALGAVFTPTDPEAFAASTSAPVPYTVTEGEAPPEDPDLVDTTTTLALPVDFSLVGDTVPVTVAVTPADAAGTVQLLAGDDEVGEAAVVADGAATVSATDLPAGDLSLTAAFTPEDAEAFGESESAPVTHWVLAVPETGTAGYDETGSALGENPTVAPGSLLLVAAGGFTPDEQVGVLSTGGGALGAAIANAAGGVLVPYVVGPGAGPQTVTFLGEESDVMADFAFQVSGDGTAPGGGPADGGGQVVDVDDVGSSLPTDGGFGDGGQVSGSGLPRTGSEPLPLVVAGLALLAAGAVALVTGRRRQWLSFADLDRQGGV